MNATEELYHWLAKTHRSRAMLINGNSDPLEYLSPLSLFTGHLTSLFAKAKPCIVLSYFCGLHMNFGDDPRSNARGMMVSFISQLLSQGKYKGVVFDLAGMIDEDFDMLKKEDDLPTLCKLFRNLVRQVPENKVLFCAVDGMSLYELSSEADDMLYVWRVLEGLLGDKKMKTVLKLLATCPGESGYVRDARDFKHGDVLLVPPHVDGSRQGVWNTNDLDSSIYESYLS